jgi:hypothetical protein
MPEMDDNGAKRVKTAHFVRLVPSYSSLIDPGLSGYACKSKGPGPAGYAQTPLHGARISYSSTAIFNISEELPGLLRFFITPLKQSQVDYEILKKALGM